MTHQMCLWPCLHLPLRCVLVNRITSRLIFFFFLCLFECFRPHERLHYKHNPVYLWKWSKVDKLNTFYTRSHLYLAFVHLWSDQWKGILISGVNRTPHCCTGSDYCNPWMHFDSLCVISQFRFWLQCCGRWIIFWDVEHKNCILFSHYSHKSTFYKLQRSQKWAFNWRRG